MAIPDFQSFMLPVLQAFADGQAKHKQEIYDYVAHFLMLTEADQKELLPSGNQEIYLNRIAWSLTSLKHALLLSSPERGVYQITDRGKTVLENPPAKLDNNYLMQFPEFIQFKKGGKNKVASSSEAESADKTPQEYIELGYQQITEELTANILDAVKGCSPFFFEKLVVDLLLAMGYGGSKAEAGKVTQKTGDDGIDGIINEDKLGLDTIYIQAKKWDSPVGQPEIQKFAGALLGKQSKKGVFITTSTFSSKALDYAEKIDSKIVLIDGARLAKLMIAHNVGVAVAQRFEIKRLDTDYFLED